MASSYLLALNCGSSSLKASLLLYPSLEAVASLSASSIGSEQATLKVKRAGQNDDVSSVKGESHAEIFSDILEKIQGLHLIRGDVQEQIRIVTHRIVHGGTFSEPVVVTKDHTEALAKMEEVGAGAAGRHRLELSTEGSLLLRLSRCPFSSSPQLSAFAPLHNHHAVLTVKAVLEALPKAKNLLCFDTLVRNRSPLTFPSPFFFFLQ
jgi:acetate kinase